MTTKIDALAQKKQNKTKNPVVFWSKHDIAATERKRNWGDRKKFWIMQKSIYINLVAQLVLNWTPWIFQLLISAKTKNKTSLEKWSMSRPRVLQSPNLVLMYIYVCFPPEHLLYNISSYVLQFKLLLLCFYNCTFVCYVLPYCL